MKRIALVYGYGQLANGELDEQSIGRCRRALAFYNTNKAQEIYITVGVKRDGYAMAWKMREWLTSHSIWAFDIVVDSRGLNTAGETEICHQLLGARANRCNVTAISSWYHLPRIWILWLLRGRVVRLAGSSEGVHLKDILIEPLKLVNSTLRPFSSAKLISQTTKAEK